MTYIHSSHTSNEDSRCKDYSTGVYFEFAEMEMVIHLRGLTPKGSASFFLKNAKKHPVLKAS